MKQKAKRVLWGTILLCIVESYVIFKFIVIPNL
jgi:hypothetical protein